MVSATRSTCSIRFYRALGKATVSNRRNSHERHYSSSSITAQCTESRRRARPLSPPPPFKIYTAVDPADSIHRDMPPEHPALLSEAEFRELITGVDPKTAAVQWACRTLPLPANARSDLGCWAFFAEAAPGMWVRFEDLPEELAEALLEKNLYELIMRPIQRPFSAEQLAELVEEITQIDPATAVCDWTYADFCDPYGLGDVPHVQVGRAEFVKASGDRWVWFGDLPAETATALREKREGKLAFPAGLDALLQEMLEEPEQAAGK